VPKKLLITFGCSWTYAVGAYWYPNIEKTKFESLAWNSDACFQYSFRNLLCQAFDLKNINFSEGGSSNQRQFRYAKEYFGSDDFKRDSDAFDQIIVMHGITATGRNEFYSIEFQKFINLHYNQAIKNTNIDKKFHKLCAEFMIKNCYDHDNEIKQLETEFKFWDNFYASQNIKNIWVDTFNHHEYAFVAPSMLGRDLPQRDLMSQLAIRNGIDKVDAAYHNSEWAVDSGRVEFLLSKEILNPFTLHPTPEGHKQIFEIIKNYFVENNIVI
jgi:hypothetical protein